MALAFPLLVLVALGLVQFALFAHAHNVVEAAVQDGARAAAAQGATLADGRRRADAVLNAGLRPGVQVKVDWSASTTDVIQASASGVLHTFFPWFNFSTGLTHLDLPLNATATVSRERFRGGL